MVCKKCYYNNDENTKFCIKCGEKLEPEATRLQYTKHKFKYSKYKC